MPKAFPNKGELVTLKGIEAKPVALSGMQMKLGATMFEVTGHVAHVRGDSLDAPTQVGIWLKVDEAYKATPEMKVETCPKCGLPEVGPID